MGKVINFYKGLGKGRSQTQVRAQPFVVTPELDTRSTAPAATFAGLLKASGLVRREFSRYRLFSIDTQVCLQTFRVSCRCSMVFNGPAVSIVPVELDALDARGAAGQL
jgi:hypothetical protein